jgi:type I restriction enzyme, S subunit
VNKSPGNANLLIGAGQNANQEIGVPGSAADHPGAAVRNGWQKRNLGELCTLISGRHLDPKQQNTESRGIGYLTGPADFGPLNPVVSRWTEDPQALAKRGDILITVKGAGVGKINLLDAESVAISRQLMSVRVADADYRFIYAFLGWQFDYFQSRGSGATVPGLSREDVLGLQVLLPPLPEQRRIVGILDEAFDGIATAKANAEKNLQNARALFESHLQAVFTQRGEGWVDRRLGDLATFRNGINFTRSSRGDSVRIVGVKDFQKSFWAPLDKLDCVTIEGTLPDSDTLKENDLLFVRSNGNMELIGRCLLVGPVADRITHSGFTIRARFNGGGAMPKYLCHYLKSNKAKREMIDSGIGTNIKSLNQATLSALVIPLPPRAEQSRIVRQLEALDDETQRLESIYQQKLAALDKLKKSLLHQAFSGEL